MTSQSSTAVCEECGYSFVFNLKQPVVACREPEGPEPRKWKQLNEFVESHELASTYRRPYLVLQKAEHESFEEIEQLDEFKELRSNDVDTSKEAFVFKLWCPHCKSDLSAGVGLNTEPSSESFSQYATARSRSSSTSSYMELASLGSEIIPEKPPIRRFSTQSNQRQSPSLVISPRFSSTRRKSVREKRPVEKASPRKASSAILGSAHQAVARKAPPDKSSSPSTGSRSKTTTASNSTTVSMAKYSPSNLEHYNVETYLKKNQQTGSIKQLTVIRYNGRRRRAEGAQKQDHQ